VYDDDDDVYDSGQCRVVGIPGSLTSGQLKKVGPVKSSQVKSLSHTVLVLYRQVL
jgi:hypothetical protein